MGNNIAEILSDIEGEVRRADAKWGHPRDCDDGTGHKPWKDLASMARYLCDTEFGKGTGTWQHILAEEFYEAIAESDPELLRAELTQVAAVCVSWMRAIEERGQK